MAAPTLAATFGNNAITQGATKTVSVTVQAGDLVLVKAATDYPTTHVYAPTGGGLTFAAQQVIENLPDQSNAYVWTAQSSTAQTFTLSITASSTGYWSFEVKVWRSHGGVGTSAKRVATSTGGFSLTTSGADSAIELLNADWNAVDGTTRTWLTSAAAFTETSYQRASQALTFYAGHHADVVTAGTVTVGMSAPAGQAPSQIAVEILAAPPAQTGSLSITATTIPANVPPAVQVNINDTRSPGQASSLTVMRINADGTRSPVRTSDGNALPLASGVGVVYDYEAPLGQPVSYTSVEVPGITSPQVTVSSAQVWLVHPGTPSLSMPIKLAPNLTPRRVRPVVRGVFNVMGRANPVIVTDGIRHGRMMELSLHLQTQAVRDAFDALTADASTLLLNVPTSLGYNIATSYIAVGDIETLPITDKVFEPWFTARLPYYEVDRPAGGSQSQRTYSDLLAAFGTYAAVQANYRTYLDLLTGP